MKVVITGAEGFLGWHTRARAHALTDHEVVPVGRSTWPDLRSQVVGADAVIHIAGVNRGEPQQVEEGNVALARDVADAIAASGSAPRIVYANSIHTGADTPYGRGKREAAAVLARGADELGSRFVDVRLPNLFGEHGRPAYNSFVATFTDCVIDQRVPSIEDREVTLLHVQPAAQVLLDALTTTQEHLRPDGTRTTVQGVYDTLHAANALYERGDIPPLGSDLDLDLFNTLRAARFPDHYPIRLEPRSDQRGTLVETVRAHDGQGQTFVSTTNPGFTRGEHYHLRKVERFVVLSGRARISLRRLFSDQVVSYDVSGDDPVALDMPTMWVHNITNTGTTELTTLFWTHDLFDPAATDTYPEPVCVCPAAVGDELPC